MGPVYVEPEEGFVQLSWDDVMEICKDLSSEVMSEYNPQLVIGIAKAGLIPAAIIASILRLDLYPIKISRRLRQRVIRRRPEIITGMPSEVSGKSILIVDEVCVTGETLRLAKLDAEKNGARRVKTLTFYSRTEAQMPDYFALLTDSVVIQPWDFEVFEQGEFVLNPEYQAEFERR